MRTAMRQMMGVFGQLERSMVVARLRRGREMKRAAGGYAAGWPPYGCRADDGSLVVVPEEQRAVRLDEVSRLLNSDAGRSQSVP